MNIVNCHKTNGHKLKVTCNQPFWCVVWHCQWMVFSDIWKEHRRLHTQLHSITSQHTKILHPLPCWALYCYIWHTHFHVLTYRASGKEHDFDKQ